jgi:phosphatidylserine/phosphatidylglycerophosphate/cardiolipin synthase-like enzyme
VVFYSLIGSQNQNDRSMVVDAEVAFVISGWPSIIPYLDLISLVGLSRWIQDTADLDALIPPQSEWRRRIARWARIAF